MTPRACAVVQNVEPLLAGDMARKNLDRDLAVELGIACARTSPMPPAPMGVRISEGRSRAPVESGMRLIQLSLLDRKLDRGRITGKPSLTFATRPTVLYHSWDWEWRSCRVAFFREWRGFERVADGLKLCMC